MPLSGKLLIGRRAVEGGAGEIRGVDAATGTRLEPAFHGATKAQLDEACELAWTAFDVYREASLEQRAGFLEAIADHIAGLGDELVERTMAESGLPRARVEGERGRTIGQLRMFADVVRAGDWLGARIDPRQPDRQPAPRPDLRQRHIPLGPIAVFGASNFPLAFSVAGGDTAAALAAGCPVVAKAHPAHPGVSALVGRAIQQAVSVCGLPEGVFSLLFDSGLSVSQDLVRDQRIKGVGFTGSRAGGEALVRIAQARPEPIPVYAEMSSVNPVIVMPNALRARGAEIAAAYVASMTQGAGQFCTNPGLVLGVEGPDLDALAGLASEVLGRVPAAVMLTGAIRANFETGVQRLADHPGVTALGRGAAAEPPLARAALFATGAGELLRDPELQDEVFGAASMIVGCRDIDQLRDVIENLTGQLTIAVHMDAGDEPFVRDLLPTLERKAGRILVNGFGTGVEVSHAMVHGGPYPATSDGRSTSVGSLAIHRFLRPVCYQDFPADLLPAALQDANPLGLRRLMDGRPSQP